MGRENRPLRRLFELGGSSSRDLLELYPTSGLSKKISLTLYRNVTRPQIVHGQNMALLISSIASKHPGFSRQANAPMGTCKCAGGAGHCMSCKRTELNTQMVRPRGENGPPGERGSFAPPITLLSGMNGHSGVGHVKALHGDGTEDTYTSRYRLELVSFEIQDENHDGIFEPGECIVIQRIRIKNSGASQLNLYFIENHQTDPELRWNAVA